MAVTTDIQTVVVTSTVTNNGVSTTVDAPVTVSVETGGGTTSVTDLQGPRGVAGIAGVAGADGNTVLYGSGAPANSLGVNGNFYIDDVAHAIYGPKAAGAWPAGTSLVGPQGPAGTVDAAALAAFMQGDAVIDVNGNVTVRSTNGGGLIMSYLNGGGPTGWVAGEWRITPPKDFVVENAVTHAFVEFDPDTYGYGVMWGGNVDWSQVWGVGAPTANGRFGLISGGSAFEFDNAPYVGTNVVFHAGNLPANLGYLAALNLTGQSGKALVVNGTTDGFVFADLASGPAGADGNTVLYGSGAPASGTGVNGNFYIDDVAHTIYGPKAAGAWPAGTSLVGPQGTQGIQGIQGVQGNAGTNGADGNTVLYGSGAPASGLGVDGNFYIDTTAHAIYGPKAAGAWPAGTSLIGPQGIQGIQGIQGVQGNAGTNGTNGTNGTDGNTVLYGSGAPASGTGVNGNFYIDTTANAIYGPKAAGAWPAGTSLVGPQGTQGIQGIQGVQGNAGADGNTVLYGSGAPASGTGVNGNFYINTTSNTLYGPKAAGAWPAGTSLVGPQGTQGIQGTAGTNGVDGNTVLYGSGAPASGTGVNGNFYINTTSNTLYGPKAAGAWPAGTSLVGPTGPAGTGGDIVRTVFTASGTFTKNAKTKSILVQAWAGGGGGGGGAKNASAANAIGGSGGGGGSYAEVKFDPALFSAGGVTVTIGAGGTGGTPSGTNATNTSGVNGGITTLGSGIMSVNGGGGAVSSTGGASGTPSATAGGTSAGGVAGTATGSAPAAPTNPWAGAGGTGNGTTATSGSGGRAMRGGAGGGSGGSVSSAAALTAGGDGGNGYNSPVTVPGGGTTGGGAGGTKAAASDGTPGCGGAGGGSAVGGTNGGVGGAGQQPGGGGGGGGGSQNGGTGGAGGKGGDGLVIITEFLGP